ncbi:SixA phosphatase family protein [Sphingomonas sp.]|jgi:phosphohistidine phosphatase|uniref:SixA phosphatase family protein n=1 Tax=Sphingomonas sp. TaxID=28214 RepID=UPI002E302833|nr:histidine phosphatase family protein [Sphingomonas sp.]HEX4695417.1 histidine phosphatase family protein [Sphingomonas sp.]
MKTLILLRHAKSGWDDRAAPDFDRRLNAKGERAARMMGRHMRDAGIGWDHAIASPAARVVETLAAISHGYGHAIEPEWDRRAYLAVPAMLIELAHMAPDDADRLLLSGHNPGLEELVLLLVPDRAGDSLRDSVEAKFPTASLAVITFPVARWADILPGAGTLVAFTRPRDLDPTLGPDAD